VLSPGTAGEYTTARSKEVVTRLFLFRHDGTIRGTVAVLVAFCSASGGSVHSPQIDDSQ